MWTSSEGVPAQEAKLIRCKAWCLYSYRMSSLQCEPVHSCSVIIAGRTSPKIFGPVTLARLSTNQFNALLKLSLKHELSITRPNVFRLSASLTGVVSRSKQIAGTFELIHRLYVWKSLTKLVMTIILLPNNIEIVQRVILILIFFFLYLSSRLLMLNISNPINLCIKYISELFL